MVEVLKQHLIDRLGKQPDNLDVVLAHFKPVHAKRNELLLTQGNVCRYCYFVAKGCIQVFVYDTAGNESTRDVVFENNWVTELNSFVQQVPAIENLRAIEPTDLLAISYEGFGQMMQTVPQFETVYRQIMELSYANSVFRINSFVAMDATERLQWLAEHRPKILARISNKIVASYLGISPETLSRVKAKL